MFIEVYLCGCYEILLFVSMCIWILIKTNVGNIEFLLELFSILLSNNLWRLLRN